MRLIKELQECLPKVCHNIALASTDLYYTLFKRVDALEAEIQELTVFLNYDIDGLSEINRYYRDVADKVKGYSVGMQLHTGAINDLINGQRAIEVMLDNYKDDVASIDTLSEEEAVFPEGLLEPEPEVVKSEEAVKELNAEADAIAEAKAKEIEAQRAAVAEAQNKVDATTKKAQEAKKSVEALQKELEKAKEQADAYTKTLEAEAARGTPASYIDTPFGAVRTDGTFGGVITKFASEESVIKGEEARIIEGVIEKTGDLIDRAINVAAGYEDVKGVLERGGTYEEALQVAKDNLDPKTGIAGKLSTADIEEEARALVETVQERIDVENAAAGISGALEKISELENAVGEEKTKYEKAMKDAVEARSELNSLGSTISNDARERVNEARASEGSDSGGGDGSNPRDQESPRGGDTGEHRAEKEEREKEAREKLERDIEEGKYDKDIQDAYDREHVDNGDD